MVLRAGSGLCSFIDTRVADGGGGGDDDDESRLAKLHLGGRGKLASGVEFILRRIVPSWTSWSVSKQPGPAYDEPPARD